MRKNAVVLGVMVLIAGLVSVLDAYLGRRLVRIQFIPKRVILKAQSHYLAWVEHQHLVQQLRSKVQALFPQPNLIGLTCGCGSANVFSTLNVSIVTVCSLN